MKNIDNPAHPVLWGKEPVKEDGEAPIAPPFIPYLPELATRLYGMGDQQRSSIDETMEELELDRYSRLDRFIDQGATKEEIEEKKKKWTKKSLYKINKGLMLELLLSCLMYRLDSPSLSRANCNLFNSWPSNHAPPGYPDVVVDFGKRFSVHVEVSSNKQMSEHYFRYELDSTLKHMQAKNVRWGLLITDWDITVSKKRRAYAAFTEVNKKDLKKYNIIILSIVEMAELSMALASDMDFLKGKKRITAENMATLFRKMRVASTEDKPNLRDHWIETVADILNPKKNKDKDKETTPDATPAP